jgi:RHS repeat-associated protein
MYQPRNVVTSIMSGLGAITGVTYSPLTYTSVYYREYTGFSLASGWGSPVQDVLSPRYVVSLAQSSAPTSTSINALSNVRYRYSGFKMQGGGRGSLGFDKVYSIDGQTGIETVTAYNQAFPLTGTPNATAAYTDGVAVDSVCGNPDSAACMAYGTVTDIQANQQLLSSTQDNWAWHVFNQPSNNYSTALSAPSPIYVLRSTNHTWKYGLDQTLLSSQATGFVYDVTYGNALNTFSTEYSGVQHFSRNAVRNTTTIQTYNNVDVPPTSANSYKATWHISRLLTSQTTVTPWAAGVADTAHAITRNSEFAYDANTGQLTAEHLQPLSSTDGAPAGTADQALDKYHFYDAYGNETETVTCSASMACSSSVPLAASAMAFHSTNQNSVQRYSRSDYSATGGIYANTTYAPFWNGSGATEKTTLTVNARDGFGNPTQTTDMHGVVAVSKYSALGRAYFTATNTGVAAQTIYRFCSGYGAPAVPCPPGAAYRVDTNTTAGTGGNSRAPETWAYFDVLTRPVLKLEQGFASGQYNAVQTTYDSLGRVYQQSEPYLTYAPTSASIGVPIGPIYYTTTQYDALGRVVSVMHPNSFATTTTYTGLDTTVTMPNNGTGYVETKKQTLNLLGQVAIVTDAVGSTLKYYYDATGNVTQVDRAGNDGRTASTFMGYDTLSRKTSLNDPDAGNWTYQYNALAEQVIKLNSSATPTCTVTAYDGQGRPFSRLDYANASCSGATDASATWTYDTAGNGLGSLATSTSTDNPSSINGIATTELRYAYYDSFGRVSELDTSINGVQYKQFSTYDQYGRAFQSLFSGTGLPQSGELYSYNSLGYLYQTQDAENGLAGQIYQTIGAVDARGHVTQEQRANNPALTTVRSYRPDNGWLSGISTGSPSGGTTNGAIENLAYGYDKVGNMVSRTDTSPGAAIYEKSSYDILQRLTQQLVGPSDTGPFTPTISRTYDSFGNPNPSSSLYGTYSTNAAAPKCGGAAGPTEVPTPGPDAPIGDTGGVDVRCYDSHGNVTRLLEQGNTPTVVKRQEWYNSYDAARRVAFSASFESHTTDWAYGGDRQRLLRADYLNSTASGSPKVTHYLGNAEIVNATGWPRTVKRYVPGMVLSQTLSGTGTTTQQYEFLFTDNLGSTHRIVDQNGAIENPNGSQWFTPFGVRASVANGTNLDRTTRFGFDDSLTHHGFTGHEQMDESALIHMNGRIYDANGGGFEQADPFVQDPGNLQSYNRYIYLMNNPLTGTDPSGYWGRRQQGYAREVVAIAIAIYTGYYYSAAHLGAAEAAAMAASGQTAMATIMTGYLSGFISSGNLSGAVEGAFDAGLNYGIGFVKNPVANVGAHALEGGVMSAIQGGRFGHGFVSAGLNAVISPKIAEHLGTGFKGGVASAIAGGTISQLTGGKFANGAMTATFEYSFNEMLHYGVDENGRGTTSLSEPDPHAAEELRFVAGFIPGVDLVACGISGCSGVEWVMAGLAIIPGEGKAASVVEGVVAKVVRTRAETLAEQLSLKEAEAGAGRRIMQGQQMKDPKFPAEEWAKMQHVHTTPEGQNIVIHYWERIEDAFRTGFKFKD